MKVKIAARSGEEYIPAIMFVDGLAVHKSYNEYSPTKVRDGSYSVTHRESGKTVTPESFELKHHAVKYAKLFSERFKTLSPETELTREVERAGGYRITVEIARQAKSVERSRTNLEEKKDLPQLGVTVEASTVAESGKKPISRIRKRTAK